MRVVLGKLGAENDVPELGGHSVAGIFTTVMMLVVVALQSSEVASGLPDVVKRIVSEIIANVTVK